MRGLILVELVGHVAEWLRRGLQILSVYDLTLIISLLINIFTFNKDCKYSPVPLLCHRYNPPLLKAKPFDFGWVQRGPNPFLKFLSRLKVDPLRQYFCCTTGNNGWPPCSDIVLLNLVSSEIPAGSKFSLIFLVDKKCLATFAMVPFKVPFWFQI